MIIRELETKGAVPPNMLSTYFNTQYVKPGSSAQEKCQADGDPKPTLFWKKDGVPLSTDAQYEIDSSTGDIKINNVTDASGEGTYQCFAQNSQGTVLSGFWEVKVAHLNCFDMAKTTSPTVNEYSYYSLPCNYQPSSVPASQVNWLVGAGDNTTFPTTPEDKHRVILDADGTLHFLFLRFSDNANNPYRCQLVNDIVSRKAVSLEKFILNVLRFPELTSKPILKYSKSVEGTIGSKAILLCIFAGNPIPNVLWIKDGVRLPDTSLPDGTQRYNTDSTGLKLTIPKLEFKDEGNYTCRATNAYGTNEGTVQVRVTGPLQLSIKPPMSTRITVGETAIIHCDTVSYHVNISSPMWMTNGVLINDSKSLFSADLRQLRIPNVTLNDKMCIQCMVHNYREYGPHPEPGIVGTTFGNTCLTALGTGLHQAPYIAGTTFGNTCLTVLVSAPMIPATAALIPWYIALVIGIIILFIIALIVWYLYRNRGGYYSVDKRSTRQVMTLKRNSMTGFYDFIELV